MITMQELETFVFDPNDKSKGIALAWVIDEDVVYDTVLNTDKAMFLLEATSVVDISDQYPEHEGIVLRYIKDEDVIQELKTDEYFGSLSLSNPKIINLSNHENGAFVISPNAKFINNKFVIEIFSNPQGLPPTHGMEMENNPHPCGIYCKCDAINV